MSFEVHIYSICLSSIYGSFMNKINIYDN